MTPDERENLVKDMAQSMVPLPLHLFTKREQQRAIDAATAALAIAQTAFAKQIEAAYKEGFSAANAKIMRCMDPEGADVEWYDSRAYATILASIPEKNDDR